MNKNLKIWTFIVIGFIMFLGSFKKTINLEPIPFESFFYNLGRYFGTYIRTFLGVALFCKVVLNLKYKANFFQSITFNGKSFSI